MPASPAYLAALKAGMNPTAAPDPVDYSGIDITPGPGTLPAPLAASPDVPSNDPLARLEGDPNGRIAPLTQAQALGINRGSIAPRQPEAIPTGKMVPVFNAAGQQIGEEPETKGGELFKSPFSHGPVTFDASAGKPVGPAAKPESKPEGALDPSTVAYTEPKPTQRPEGAGGPIAMPSGGRGGVAQDSGLGKAFDEKKAAIAGVAQAEQRQIEDEGVGHALMGQTITQQAEEARRRAIDVDTAAKMREKEIEDQAKIVSEMKVDPDRRWSNASVGSKIALLIGAAFSGFASGFNHQSGNAALEMASRLQEQDIDAQKFNIESAKGKIGEMRGSLADFYKRTGNMDQAVALANAKALDARIEQTNAYAVGSKSASAEARARDIVADMDMQRAQWLAKAQAAAAGSGNGVRKQFETLTQENMKQGDDLRTAQARAAAVLGIQDTGNIGSFTGKGTKGGEIAERQAANDEANRQFDSLLKSPTLDKLGAGTATLSKLPAQLAPDSNKTKSELQSINLQIIGAASKVLKDNEGRIPPSVLERLHDLEIAPSDTPEQARQKVNGAREFINSLSRQSGTEAPVPNAAGGAQSKVNFAPGPVK